MGIMTNQISKDEARELRNYILDLADEIPRGLSGLSDAISFAALDLTSYIRFDIKLRSFERAITFVRSIPRFKDFQSEECAKWMLNDVEHVKYWE